MTAVGATWINSLVSLRPKPVTARIALITGIIFFLRNPSKIISTVGESSNFSATATCLESSLILTFTGIFYSSDRLFEPPISLG